MKKHIFVVGYRRVGYCHIRYFDIHIMSESLESIEVSKLVIEACQDHYKLTCNQLPGLLNIEITLLSFIASFNESNNSKTKTVEIIHKDEPEVGDGHSIPTSIAFSNNSIPLKTK